MSNGPDHSHDNTGFELILEEKIEAKEPSLYHVVMLNDDYTPMDFVIHVLQNVFHHPIEAATKMMLQVHQEGKSRVGTYTFDIANTKIDKVHALAENEQHPLQCGIEPDGDNNAN